MNEPELDIVPPGSRDRPAAMRRRRGRPLLMAPHEVLDHIRRLGERDALFRVHLDHPALYARARRQFGSWAGALTIAGIDAAGALAEARRRSLAARREREPRNAAR